MNTPFINFGGMGPRFSCRACGVGTGHATATAVLPGSSSKDPDPPARVGRRIRYGTGLWCWYRVPKAASTGSTRPKSQVTESGIAAATPLPEPGLQMTSGALFCHHEEPGGVGPAAPYPANRPPSLPVGTTPSATCQLCLPSLPFNLSPTSQRCG
ncbi:uncharacterized protein TrAtP1_000998 [Trichoderma atroviride]|uniref:Uncharacterized protein n=1 Tax=Hypocrea atroviridis (strain ATCC 20476 / IMI 206040) TaxID=452589 RepID=G9NMX3_HYPAI|nr:uncharacterized protein TRIATDRAFT_305989 [Trichoderma atroviride IMI 206040]EHK48253.1 hypothetical protein TRIATDRAFT_305989 [Trichoderma atroviride IMI 206040]UKZ59700.1 hypothetical protein TrAtP1_000998 [Trichoderma atroviride]